MQIAPQVATIPGSLGTNSLFQGTTQGEQQKRTSEELTQSKYKGNNRTGICGRAGGGMHQVAQHSSSASWLPAALQTVKLFNTGHIKKTQERREKGKSVTLAIAVPARGSRSFSSALPRLLQQANMATQTEWSCLTCHIAQEHFCLGCIVWWAKRRLDCPLCRQTINSTNYFVRSEADFLEMVIPHISDSLAASCQDKQGAVEPVPRTSFQPTVCEGLFNHCSEVLEPLLAWINQEFVYRQKPISARQSRVVGRVMTMTQRNSLSHFWYRQRPISARQSCVVGRVTTMTQRNRLASNFINWQIPQTDKLNELRFFCAGFEDNFVEIKWIFTEHHREQTKKKKVEFCQKTYTCMGSSPMATGPARSLLLPGISMGCSILQGMSACCGPVPMLDNPFREEIFPNIESKPPVVQLEAVSSRPITRYLEKETDTHLATTSFQKGTMSALAHLGRTAGYKHEDRTAVPEQGWASNVTCLVDERKAVDVAFLDCRKAFDTVPHSILLDKLSNCEMSR
ncbi:hypothetical protein QYF61_003020 [Mycteria americana]|uniref:Reverse transcriptase domain-containing protein n=1 Tax=Mycteria americana TaxID=33587 RepID=A0AAN7N0K5_MYCAM|nr:hypothetical protein QYF61_003020 [Mycteria americana]